MPRGEPSHADVALLNALSERGYRVSPYQLERWRAAGLLSRNRRRGLGRGRGSISEIDESALAVAAALAEEGRQGRALDNSHVLERFAMGRPVAEGSVRRAFAAELNRLGRKLGADAGTNDAGWQERRDKARRAARGEPRSVITLLHFMSGGTEEVSDEELTLAFAHLLQMSDDEVPRLLQQVLVAQREGRDWRPAEVITLSGLQQLLDRTGFDELRRAAMLVHAIFVFHVILTTIQLVTLQHTERAPEALRRFVADDLRRIQATHEWHTWSARLAVYGQGRRPRLRALAITPLLLLAAPEQSRQYAAYRDSLAALYQSEAVRTSLRFIVEAGGLA